MAGAENLESQRGFKRTRFIPHATLRFRACPFVGDGSELDVTGKHGVFYSRPLNSEDRLRFAMHSARLLHSDTRGELSGLRRDRSRILSLPL